MKKFLKSGLKKFLVFIALSATLISISSPILSPENIGAANPAADIFTGQVIPAFIGAEYDPTVAFQALSGATIYVFAYDNWEATNPIVENKVVRTQIRADGTFQAMGLPHAAYYGVYFPYNENGATEGQKYKCWTSTDIFQGRSGGEHVYPESGIVEDGGSINTTIRFCSTPTYAQENSLQATPFRTPVLEDKITDVFSYMQTQYPYDKNNPIDQLGNTVYLNNNGNATDGGRKVFITSANRLDIENHVNVFPVIPTSVLNIEFNNYFYGKGEGMVSNASGDIMLPEAIRNQSFSVSAVRIAYFRDRTIFGLGDLPKFPYTTSPVIQGSSDKNGNFKAYAPAGYYAITYSLGDNTSIAFKEIDPLGANQEFIDATNRDTLIDLSLWQGDAGESFASDYRIYRDGLHIWGIATKKQEIVGSSLESQMMQAIDPTIDDVQVVISGNSYQNEGTASLRRFNTVSLSDNQNEADVTDTATPNRLGIYYFRTSDVYDPITGSIKITSENNIDQPPSLGGTILCDPQKQQLSGFMSGIENFNFTLSPTPQTGFLITVKDASNMPVSGANIMVVSTENYDSVKSLANEKYAAATNNQGQVYLSPFLFTEESSGCDSDTITEDYMVVASKGDNFKANITLLAGEGGGDGGIIDSCTRLVDGITITPIGQNNLEENPLFVRLANLTSLQSISPIRAAETPLECYAYDVNDSGVESGPYEMDEDGNFGTMTGGDFKNSIPLTTIYTTVNNMPKSNVLMAQIISGNDSYVFKVEQKDNVFLDEVHSHTKPGAFYEPNTGNMKLNIPCKIDDWLIRLEAGESINPKLNEDLEEGAIQEEDFRSATRPLVLKVIGAILTIPGTSGILLHKAMNSGDETQRRINGLTNTKLTSGDNRSSSMQTISISNEETGEYFAEPYSLVFTLAPECPSVKILEADWDSFESMLTCNVAKELGNLLEKSTYFIESILMHTPPVSSIPTVTFMWNLFRNIANGLVVLVLIYFIIRYMFRMESKDLPIKTLPMRLVKGVIMANLSLLYCQLFIDLANLSVRAISNSIVNAYEAQITAGNLGTSIISGIGTYGAAMGALAVQAGTAAIGVGTTVASLSIVSTGGAVVIALVAFVILLAIALLSIVLIILIQLFLRLAIIYVCVIFAPVRFIIAILPAGEGFTKLWDGIFYSFVFMQTVAALLLSIGVTFVGYLTPGVSFLQGAAQFVIGVAVGLMAIKSPNMLLGLLGGGGAAGKMFGNLSENLSKAQTEWSQTQLSPENMAAQITTTNQKFGEARERAKDAAKLVSGKGKGALVAAGAGLGAGAGFLARNYLKPIARAEQGSQRAKAQMFQEKVNELNEGQRDEWLKGQRNNIALGRDANIVDKRIKEEAKQNGVIGDEGIGQYAKDVAQTYDAMDERTNLQLSKDKANQLGINGKDKKPLTNMQLLQDYNVDVLAHSSKEEMAALLKDVDLKGRTSDNIHVDLQAGRLSNQLLTALTQGVTKNEQALHAIEANTGRQFMMPQPGSPVITMNGTQAGQFASWAHHKYQETPAIQQIEKAYTDYHISPNGLVAQRIFENANDPSAAGNTRIRRARQRNPQAGSPMMNPMMNPMMMGQQGVQGQQTQGKN